MTRRSGIACHPIDGAACAATLFRQRGALWLSVAVKATLSLVPDGAMALVAAEPLRLNDVHHGDSPARSLRAAGEIVPYKPRVDVTVVGHAYPPGGSAPVSSVRLAVFRGREALVDKTIHVFGDRALDAQGKPGKPAAFARMELVYERALRGDDNPLGVRPDKKAPNLVDPNRSDATAAFGPISRYAKSRSKLLGGVDRTDLEATIALLPDAFDGAYFQTAPADQQLPLLVGDEWVVLDGFSPDRPRISSQLPRVRAEACVVAVGPEAAAAIGSTVCSYRRLRLRADTLHIDADAGRVILVWRGAMALSSEDLDDVRVVGGVVVDDGQLAWPDPRSLGAAAPAEEEEAEAETFDATRSIRVGDLAKATPFEAAPSLVSPWGPVAIKPIPQPIGAGTVTYADATGSTMTLTPEQRAGVKTGPFAIASPGGGRFEPPPGAPFAKDGTRELTAGDLARATAAPFALAEADDGRRFEAPEGAPFAARAARAVPVPIGGETMDVSREAAEVDRSSLFHEAPRPDRKAGEDVSPIPRRTTDSIPVVCREGLWLVTSPWQHRPPRDSLTIIVKATYDIVPDREVKRREEADLPTGDLHHDDDPARSLRYPSDMAHFKPRADVVMLGHAYPTERGGVATQVRFRFGAPASPRFDRRVAVFGDRHFKRAILSLAATDPEPFERVPLVYELAFGGPGYGQNPVGRGYRGGSDGVLRLPNLEDPDHLIKGPENRPKPACFGPIAPEWASRWRRMGTFSAKWLREQWPYFPDDFDWEHYQCAPREQQTDYLDGDEPFLITGAHPEHTHLTGRLSGEKPRCFMVTRGESAGVPGADLAFEEVKLRLDTAVFDLDAMTVNLVWRGIVEVESELAPEIETLFLMVDGPGQETSNEEAYARLLAEVALDAHKKPPEEEIPPANDVAEESPEGEEEDPEALRFQKEVEEDQEEMREALLAQGIDPDEVPPELPPPDLEAIAASLREGGASEEDVAALLGALKRAPDDEEDEKEAPEITSRQRAEQLLAAKASFDGVDLAGGDLSDLDFSGCSMRGARLSGVMGARARFVGADLEGSDLSRADLAGADLSNANLSGADLTEANLVEAVLDGAILAAADLSGAKAEGARLRGARGERVRMTDGIWNRARFDGASLVRLDLTHAELDHAVFDGADLSRARLFDSRGHRASFQETILEHALCDSLDLAGANLFRVRGRSSVWEKANLADASILACDFDDATFTRASLLRADVSATSLVEARMSRVDATSAKFVKSNLREAKLKSAIFRDADFTSANLYAAEVWKAELRGADFNQAILAMTKLESR